MNLIVGARPTCAASGGNGENDPDYQVKLAIVPHGAIISNMISPLVPLSLDDAALRGVVRWQNKVCPLHGQYN
jgi:hypothetical protein